MLNGNGNGKKKKITTGSNYQVYKYDLFPKSSTVLGGKPHSPITSPIGTGFTSSLVTKAVGFFSNIFSGGKPTAANRPGIKPIGKISVLKPTGLGDIQPVGGRNLMARMTTIPKAIPVFNPAAHRAKTQLGYTGWRPTSFASIMGGFSGITGSGGETTGYRGVTTGVVGFERFATFGQSGIRNLSQMKPGESGIASGWNKLAGFARINRGDTRGYSLNRYSNFYGNTQRDIFKTIVTSQKGRGYMGSSFIGTTGGHSSVFLGKKTLRSPSRGSSLFIQHYNKPQFLHSTLGSISDAFKYDKPTYNISTSSGKKSVTRGSHPLSIDYEVYKSYMNKYFSRGTNNGYSTKKPTLYHKTWGGRYGAGGQLMRTYGFGKILKSYKGRTSSEKIPTISEYSMNLLGYDILKPPK